jgi:hypothetical protein
MRTSESEYACEACLGHGYIKVQLAKNGHDPKPDIFPDCQVCGGSGVMTKDQFNAYVESRRGA